MATAARTRPKTPPIMPITSPPELPEAPTCGCSGGGCDGGDGGDGAGRMVIDTVGCGGMDTTVNSGARNWPVAAVFTISSTMACFTASVLSRLLVVIVAMTVMELLTICSSMSSAVTPLPTRVASRAL
eukprot:1591340-Prymnesium_polylepis.1